MVDEWIEQSASVMKTTNISSNGVPVTMKPCLKGKRTLQRKNVVHFCMRITKFER